MTPDISDPRAGTHLPALARCLLATGGAVLEVGRGAWSTPFLRRWCAATGRGLVSVDDAPRWVEAFPECPGEVVDYDSDLPGLAQRGWSVVLIDHSPGERRGRDAALFAESAEFLVVHDYEKHSTRSGFEGRLHLWREAATHDHGTLVLERR